MRPIRALITLALFPVGLTLSAAAPASAGVSCEVYGGCFPTHTIIHNHKTVQIHASIRFCAEVETDGNGTPKGEVTFKLVDKAGEDREDTRIKSDKLEDGEACVRMSPDTRGLYDLIATFDAKEGSRWENSRDSDLFKVVKNETS